jgi:hypothetical protein
MELGVVFEFARLSDTDVERLPRRFPTRSTPRFQKIAGDCERH